MKINQKNKGLLVLLACLFTASNYFFAQDSTFTIEKGLKLANEKKFQDAINVFEQNVKKAPENADIYF